MKTEIPTAMGALDYCLIARGGGGVNEQFWNFQFHFVGKTISMILIKEN